MGRGTTVAFTAPRVWSMAYVVTAFYKLLPPLFKLVESVHTCFKAGDNVYMKPTLHHMEKSVLGLVLVEKGIRGRLNTRLQYLEAGGSRQAPEYCCND